jgi:uncharacterized repeat protein (TIGR03803 family)
MKNAYFRRAKSFRLGAALILATVLFAVAITTAAHGQTFTTLYNFGANLGEPSSLEGFLSQGRDGNIYGVSEYGGTHDCAVGFTCGTVFKMTPLGAMSVLFDFDNIHGAYPTGVTLATDGNFYGATAAGGIYKCQFNRCGTVFKITPDGNLTVVHNFKDDAISGEGEIPAAPPIQATDGNFYGTTSSAYYGVGTVYKITPSGAFTQLHVFGAEGDGRLPEARLLQATNGQFYGTTHAGGSLTIGTVFEMTPLGQITILHDFDYATGSYPNDPLIQATNGDLYGTSAPVAFKLTPAGEFSILYDFGRMLQGGPTGGLMQATDGNFYGLTSDGYYGAIFRIRPNGGFSWLYKFDGTAGIAPAGALFQHTNGLLYGTTASGGTYGGGTLFSLDAGLLPFAGLVSMSGQIGKNIGILGQGFTATTSVSFNEIPSTFTVFSDTYLETIVPNGALTGPVTVTTLTGALTSNKPFRVAPKILSFNPTSGTLGTPVVITGTGFTQTLRVGFGGIP